MQWYQTLGYWERKSGTLHKCILIQLSISNLFLSLFHQVDIMFTFNSVFLIHMEKHLLKSIKILSFSSAGQLVSEVNWYFSFFFPLKFNLFQIELAHSFGKFTASCCQLKKSFIGGEKVFVCIDLCFTNLWSLTQKSHEACATTR